MGRDAVSAGAVVIHQHVLKSTTGVTGCEQENGWSVWFIRLVRQAGKADKPPSTALATRIAFPPDAKVF